MPAKASSRSPSRASFAPTKAIAKAVAKTFPQKAVPHTAAQTLLQVLHRQSDACPLSQLRTYSGLQSRPLRHSLLLKEVSNEDPDKRSGNIPVAGPSRPTCRHFPQRSRGPGFHPHPRSAPASPASIPRSPAARRWLSSRSSLGLGQRPGILQTTGEHRRAHHQNPAQTDDHRHRHGRAVVQQPDQSCRSGGDAELQATEQR